MLTTNKQFNILVHKDGRACIADFGLSTLLTDLGTSTFATSHHAKGTLRWMAPELVNVLEDEPDDALLMVTPKVESDVYSFGGVMLLVRGMVLSADGRLC